MDLHALARQERSQRGNRSMCGSTILRFNVALGQPNDALKLDDASPHWAHLELLRQHSRQGYRLER